jgi:pyruvoyl-dependent arginine decarboxylase (PvlArgDC)
MKTPKLRHDGSCTACAGGWLCEYHQKETARKWNRRQTALAEAAAGQHEITLQQIEAQRELESDDGGTAREKAKRIAMFV